MGFLKKESLTKKCPYCNQKNFINAKTCMNCGLDFTQLDDCSNKEAKKAFRKRRFGESFEGEIVNVKTYPKDVSKKTVVLLAIFLGIVGAHNIYVGKYVRGYISLVLGTLFCVCTAVIAHTVELGIGVANLFSTIGRFIGIFPVCVWLYDLVAILFNRFEIPIMLKKPVEIPEEDE